MYSNTTMSIKVYLMAIPDNYHGSTVVKMLYYKSEGRWFDPS